MASAKSRHWCWTINNPTELEEFQLWELDFHDQHRYSVWGHEIGESGTPHLQGFTSFKNSTTFSFIKNILPPFQRAHIEKARGTPQQAADYCKKDATDVVEFGQPVKSPEEVGGMEIERWDAARAAAAAGDWDAIPSDIFLRYKSGLQWARQLYLQTAPVETLDGHLTGVWIYGRAGCGKSQWARAQYPDYYEKDINKWWDNYIEQPNIIIDDWDPTHARLHTRQLKIWSDRYPFQAEQKFTTRRIRPKTIIITSQYTIEQCFPEEQACAAISRRFIFKRLPEIEQRA